MWFNPAEITKPTDAPLATLATLATLQPEKNTEPEKVAEVAELAGGDGAKVHAWLDHIGATDPIERQEVIDKCRNDPSALEFFLRRYGEDCKPELATEDNRRSCQQCSNLSGDSCRAVMRREIKASYDYDRDLMRRCPGFAPRPDDPDQRAACDRWPGLF